ncbi:MAG: hypothetical protein HRK26_01215 [Rickettsiaceae bacterium H1]|nr:hypothetical protein [Rickettsiaceae bacterium H1]
MQNWKRNFFKQYGREPTKQESGREYRNRPEVKKRIKEQQREYRKRPEVKEKKKDYNKKYRNRPEVEEKMKEYQREYHREYRNRPEVKERIKEQRIKFAQKKQSHSSINTEVNPNITNTKTEHQTKSLQEEKLTEQTNAHNKEIAIHCSKTERKEYMQNWKRNFFKQYGREPTKQESFREYRNTPEIKERTKEQKRKYRNRPEVEERIKEQQRKYYQKKQAQNIQKCSNLPDLIKNIQQPINSKLVVMSVSSVISKDDFTSRAK